MAIVGISSRAGSAGQVILQSLKLNNFEGDIHLVGRTSEPIDGRPVLKSADELPEGVDLAVFTLPAAAVREAIEACARRKVGSAMIFAAGFAEVGDQRDAGCRHRHRARGRACGRRAQLPRRHQQRRRHVAAHAVRARGEARRRETASPSSARAAACSATSSAPPTGVACRSAYVISTGNEAGLESTDFLEFLADDPATRVIAIYCEQIRRPQEFLAACRRARAAGKPVVLMQAGRGAKARKAAQSHTGALIGDWATMQTQAEDAGAVVVSTMDEMMDLVEILVRYPVPPTKGPGILTASGAYVGLTNDFAEDIGLDLPELDPATLKKVSEVLPAYGNYGNPLDVTAGFSPDALPTAVKALIDDPNVGMLFISFPISTAGRGQAFNKGMADSPKPKVHGGARRHLAARRPMSCRRSTKVRRCSRARRTACCARSRSIPATAARSRARACAADPAPFAGHAEARQGRAAGMARQEGPVGGRHPRAGTASLPARRTRRSAIAKRVGYPVALEGAGRGAVAQDRGRRRHAQPRRRGGAARGLGDDAAEHQTRSARRDARWLPGREDVAARASN